MEERKKTEGSNKVKLLSWGIHTNWYKFDLTGYTVGHSRLQDGTWLANTSGVQHVTIDYENREALFQTRNTLYSCAFDDYNPKYLENCRSRWDPAQVEVAMPDEADDTSKNSLMSQKCVLDDWVRQLTNKRCKLYKHVNHDPQKAEAVEKKAKSERNKARNVRMEAAKAKLGENDIYLEVGCNRNYCFGFALFGTKEVVTEPYVHLSRGDQDSVLVFPCYSREDGLDLRYFPSDDGIEFYSDLYNLNNRSLPGKLIICNAGSSHFHVKFTNGDELTLAPGEERVCESKNEG